MHTLFKNLYLLSYFIKFSSIVLENQDIVHMSKCHLFCKPVNISFELFGLLYLCSHDRLDHCSQFFISSLSTSSFLFFFFFFCARLGFQLRASNTLPALFCVGCFQDRFSQTIYPSWPWTEILLISASSVTRITGLSHKRPVHVNL
jgi:hypothetical protein